MNITKIFNPISQAHRRALCIGSALSFILISGQTSAADVDSDSDGMPDSWEITYSLDRFEMDDREDKDNDGWTNLQEYAEDTDPTDFNSTPVVIPKTNALTIANTTLTKIDVSGVTTSIGNLNVSGDFEAMAFSPDGELFALEDFNYYLYKVDQNTGQATLIGDTGIPSAANPGMTFDDEGRLWVVGGNGPSYLYELNPFTAQATQVGRVGSWDGWSLAFHKGSLYMVDDNAQNLYKVNKDTAAPTLIGPTGLSVGAQHGMSSDGVNIWLYLESNRAIYTLYELTGAATPMFSTNVTGSVECLAIGEGLDSDGDGMPDVFEDGYGFNKFYYDDGLLDSDGDGLLNMQEYYASSDPTMKDSDSDGISDLEEYRIYRTIPMNDDSDLDGMPDGWEARFELNPLVNDANIDSDQDGISNFDEYRAGTDPKGSNGFDAWREGVSETETLEINRSEGGGSLSNAYLLAFFFLLFIRRISFRR